MAEGTEFEPVQYQVAEEPVRPADSLRDSLRAARARAQHRATTELPLPGTAGRLIGVFKALDSYSDVRAIVMRHQHLADMADQELHIAADTLAAASVTTIGIDDDGVRHDLEMPLGLGLAAYLGYDGLDNTAQAMFSMFPSTVAMMTLFADYDSWSKKSGVKADEDLAGN